MSTDEPRPPSPDLAAMRNEYAERGLDRADLAADWVSQFDRWFADAIAAELPEPNAMVLATADAAGRPSTRTVLLKGYDARGLVCYTNYGSRKGTEASENPYASLLFPWIALHRQVVVCGAVTRVDRTETDTYFASRPRGSQLGAWASPQSRVLPDRAALDEAYRTAGQRFDGGPIPTPPHWGGLRIVPETVEFWQGRASRLHDRLRFRRTGSEAWVVERLAP
ncbi:pyridoxamine 5'-phosphate oxidase [Plantactinospora sp. GCM10030261]|uniref:pyridoxamine 5'-phosphate oxidase n=1 Tax=Plantactinospora sp. GCM10030261 TaxID=3273420 RepID=UPI00360C599B